MRQKKEKDVILYSDNKMFKETDAFGQTVTRLCMIVTTILIVIGIIFLFNI
ncbi:MAG: hypothetical protein K5851_00880 [Lachnospiraceae bacterium]|nr:hypothetical protein [Lachnospiraceae bacterium]